jgi:hypothetical protein
MLELYHGFTSVCAQKARLTVAEKGLEWKSNPIHGSARDAEAIADVGQKPGVAKWWERIKARPSYETAIIKWLRPEDIARYDKLDDPWLKVSKNISDTSQPAASA